LVILVVAGYVAMMALVRLMMRRRDDLLDQLRWQVKMSKKAKKAKQERQDSLGKRNKAA
jgi:hypothetical protein